MLTLSTTYGLLISEYKILSIQGYYTCCACLHILPYHFFLLFYVYRLLARL